MSQDDRLPESPAPSARPESATAPVAARKPANPVPTPPARGGNVALAVLLALIALGAAGYVGWQQWQQQQGSAAHSQTISEMQQRLGTLESTLQTVNGERSSLRQRLGDADQVNRSMREELLGQTERLRNLEDAVGKLSEKTLSGHDATLLDETESLLRMASQRYTLFHDAQGAAAAFALADQTLATVNDGAFSGVRQSIQAEREALLRSQPASAFSALDSIQQLRMQFADLPLKPLDGSAAAQANDAWSRVRRALAGVVNVQRDNGAPLAVADARFARELTALDLAQAQAALLDYDTPAYVAALKRVEAALTEHFDTADPAVQQARGRLAGWIAQAQPMAAVELGAALKELRNLRAVHTLKSATEVAAPVPAASTVHPVAAHAPSVPGARP